MELFTEATYEQLERVLKVIDRTPPKEKAGTGIPSIGFLERWIEDALTKDDYETLQGTESTIRMWENANLWTEEP
jgi:hypothetical protein